MARLISLIGCWLLGTLLLAAPHPGASWYKLSASPRYHTVGRASGLLIGVRRSPYLWRRDAEVDTWPVIQQGTAEDTGSLPTSWSEEGAGLQLSPDPGEKKLMQKLLQENRLRSLEERRSLKEVQDGNHLKQGSWLYNDLEEEKSLEDEMARYPQEEVRRSLEENILGPGEGKRSPEETRITKEPEEVVRSLEGGQRKVKNQDRYMRSILVSGQERRPSGEDILSMFLHLQEENGSHPRGWRTPTAKNKQASYSKSKTSEWNSCEDLTLIYYKLLCRATLQFLSHSQPRPGRPRLEAEDPAADL